MADKKPRNGKLQPSLPAGANLPKTDSGTPWPTTTNSAHKADMAKHGGGSKGRTGGYGGGGSGTHSGSYGGGGGADVETAGAILGAIMYDGLTD